MHITQASTSCLHARPTCAQHTCGLSSRRPVRPAGLRLWASLARSVKAVPIAIVTVGKGNSRGAELMAAEWADKLRRCGRGAGLGTSVFGWQGAMPCSALGFSNLSLRTRPSSTLRLCCCLCRYTRLTEVQLKPNPKNAKEVAVAVAHEGERVLKARNAHARCCSYMQAQAQACMHALCGWEGAAPLLAPPPLPPATQMHPPRPAALGGPRPSRLSPPVTAWCCWMSGGGTSPLPT